MSRTSILMKCCAQGSGAFVVASAIAGAPGSAKWSFQIEDDAVRQFVAVAPDGTVYTSDNEQLYALSPDGKLLWTNDEAWGGRPISLADDGTIYTGVGHAQSAIRTVIALNPDGTTKWTYTPDPAGSLLAGPAVGPEGNIFAVQEAFDFSGLGAFALNPDGELIWSNQGSPLIHSDPGDNSPIVLNDGRFHFGIVTDGSSAPVTYTFDFDGDQLWTTWTLPTSTGSTYPRVDPSGRVIGRWGQIGMRALSMDGAEEWVSTHPGPGGISILRRPVVSSTGTIYTGDSIGVQLWAINPDGSTIWSYPSSSEFIHELGLSPDDSVLVAGGADGFGEPGWVRGYSAADGEQLWQFDLPNVGPAEQYDSIFEPVFSPDGSVVYITTYIVGTVIDYGFVHAINIVEGEPADLDGDGAVAFGDLLMLLAAWGPCNASCPEDLDASGSVGFDDLLVLLSNWSS